MNADPRENNPPTPVRMPPGTSVLVGSPERPMSRALVRAIGRLAAQTDGIQEAHLPQCFALGVMNAPEQVLVVVLRPEADENAVLGALGRGLAAILPPGRQLHVWPLPPDSEFLADIRAAGCPAVGKTHRHWWSRGR
ncbi:MAG: hypothetical protein JXR37_11325 [Kiritimatiellae bacterium]|nr:hypothetical protein [Kiritimatiellia bacterium]